FCSVAILFAALYPFIVVQTINNNSSIVLDISRSLTFDSLRVMAFVCIAIAWACSFLFMHVFLRMLAAQRPALNVWVCMLAGIAVFVGINLLTGQIFVSSLLVGIAFFLVSHAFRLYTSLRRVGYTTFSYLFFAILFLALNGAYAVQSLSRKDKVENQFRFASNFLIDRDYFGEYLLNGLAHKISEDAFIQSRMASPFLGKDAIRQKIRQVFLPSYFNKYDVEILLFTGAGMPMGNTAPYTFAELIGAYRREAFKTDYEGVYYVTSPSADVTQRYLVYAPMHRGLLHSGYIFLVMSLKRVIPENVYPELLVDHRFQQFYRTRDLSYAVFSGRNLVFSSGEYNYELFFDRTWLSDAQLRTRGLSRSGFDHIAVADENGRVAVVSSPTKSWLFILSNFSNLLVLGLSVILLVLLVVGMLNYMRGRKLFFSARIQLYLNLAFFLPLIVVSITTLSLTSVSSQEQLKTEYLNKSRNFGSHLVSLLSAYIETRTDTTIDFENELTDLAKLSNLDANVFTQQGSLIASSQPLIYTNGLLSTHINPEALHRIRHGESSFITTERVGRLNYFVSYLALRSPQSGRLIGILGIPFFQSVYSLEKVQITILANILTIFAVIFIVLLVLSFFVSRWLTFPLKFITQTLSRTSLTKINQPLTWRSDDEIGLMVKEYNQMLYKLGESKAELEQTQRELAWREIAQQVAHEIKNPLTPMKHYTATNWSER
ncbi:MAG: hypothetical protein HC859_16235, partial [Bacteroidia bacterium]|nr:hypothetical protein [Bacteroidia bacterium]